MFTKFLFVSDSTIHSIYVELLNCDYTVEMIDQ